ncbi:MAG: lysylphosphatidylglycerol synthase transmembrane domain-containing protein [Nanoarchaeota archaeon]
MISKNKLFIGILLSLFLSIFLFSKTDVYAILNTLRTVNFSLLFVAVVFYVATLMARTFRFRVLLNKRVSLFDLGLIVSTYNLLSNILPFKVGELSYIFLTKQYLHIKTGIRIISWFLSRILDVAALCLLYIVSILLLPTMTDIPSYGLLIVVVLFLCIFFSIIVASLCRSWAHNFLNNFHRRFISIRIISYFTHKILDSIDSFPGREKSSLIAKAFLISIILWIVSTLSTFFIFSSLGLTLGFSDTLFIVVSLAIVSLIPVQGVGNIGVYEGGVSVALIALGISTSQAIVYAFSLHVIQLLFTLVTGVVSGTFLLLKHHAAIKSFEST